MAGVEETLVGQEWDTVRRCSQGHWSRAGTGGLSSEEAVRLGLKAVCCLLGLKPIGVACEGNKS